MPNEFPPIEAYNEMGKIDGRCKIFVDSDLENNSIFRENSLKIVERLCGEQETREKIEERWQNV